VFQGCKEFEDFRAHEVNREIQVHGEFRESKGFKEFEDFREVRDLKVTRVIQELLDILVIPGLRVTLDRRVTPDPLRLPQVQLVIRDQ
jgi:hypothetical protein